jgi:hypothetical protein
MAKYHFAIDGNAFEAIDDTGIEYPNEDRLRVEAIRTLFDMARDVTVDGDKLELAIEAKDAMGQRVLAATLSLRIES